jgi:hypothetical protein
MKECLICGLEAENRDDIVGHNHVVVAISRHVCIEHDLELPCDDCLYFDGYTAAQNEAETLREIEDLKQ